MWATRLTGFSFPFSCIPHFSQPCQFVFVFSHQLPKTAVQPSSCSVSSLVVAGRISKEQLTYITIFIYFSQADRGLKRRSCVSSLRDGYLGLLLIGNKMRSCFPPNKRSLRGPGGSSRDLGLCAGAKICARELASVVFRGLLGAASRCLPLKTGRTLCIYPKFQIRHRDYNSNVKVFRT